MTLTKYVFIALTFLSLNSLTAAYSQEIAACSDEQIEDLKNTITDKKNDGYPHSKLLKNAQKKIVGIYAWDEDEMGMYAEVCDYVHTDHTVASSWYYWDEGSSNPKDFQKGISYRLTQDEGIAYFKILSPIKNGVVKLEMSVVGWDSASDVEQEIVFRKSILTLE